MSKDYSEDQLIEQPAMDVFEVWDGKLLMSMRRVFR